MERDSSKAGGHTGIPRASDNVALPQDLRRAAIAGRTGESSVGVVQDGAQQTGAVEKPVLISEQQADHTVAWIE